MLKLYIIQTFFVTNPCPLPKEYVLYTHENVNIFWTVWYNKGYAFCKNWFHRGYDFGSKWPTLAKWLEPNRSYMSNVLYRIASTIQQN